MPLLLPMVLMGRYHFLHPNSIHLFQSTVVPTIALSPYGLILFSLNIRIPCLTINDPLRQLQAVCGERADAHHKRSDKAPVEKAGQIEHSDEDGNEGEIADGHVHAIADLSVAGRTGLSKQEQEEVGAMCKRLIDAGRLDYLQKHGFDATLQVYVDKAMSLENVALVVKARHGGDGSG